MTGFELLHLLCEPFLPALHRIVRKKLLQTIRCYEQPIAVLDVGGRKSPYTIGIPARVTITDVSRTTTIQKKYNLGIDDWSIAQTRSKRSNIDAIIYDDMTHSQLSSNMYSIICAVEVLEHVADDHAFVSNVYRVLKKNGVFIMTTPDSKLFRGGDPSKMGKVNQRFYTKESLQELLSKYFQVVEITQSVKGHNRWHRWSLRSWSFKHPVQTALSMLGGFVNYFESWHLQRLWDVSDAMHLIACVKK